MATGLHGKEAVMAADVLIKFGGYMPDRRDQASSDDQIPVSIDVQQANIVLNLIVQSVTNTYENVNSRKSDADDASSTIIDARAHDEPGTGSV
jgi:hypothetical protein